MNSLARASAARLVDLLGREHAALGDFLVALADFDRRRVWEPLGYTGLFYFLHRELGLSKGAAHYRKVAAGLVQRFPELVEPLRDGRLCITSVVELARVMTEENRDEVLPRFFHRSKAEAREIAAALRPEVAPRREVVTVVHLDEPAARQAPGTVPAAKPASDSSGPGPAVGVPPGGSPTVVPTPAPTPTPAAEALLPGRGPARAQIDPLTADFRRLHVTVSRRFLEKLEAARAARSHASPGASAEEILEAGLDLLLERQARRRALVARPRARIAEGETGMGKEPQVEATAAEGAPTTSEATPAAAEAGPRRPRAHVPAEVRREVWTRDGGCCRWPLEGGGTCGSAIRVEVDHILPVARGGPSTPDNLRLLCRFHNDLAARQIFGERWMTLCRQPSAGWPGTAGPVGHLGPGGPGGPGGPVGRSGRSA